MTATAPVPDTSPSEVWHFSLDNLTLDELHAAKARVDAAIRLFAASSNLIWQNIAHRTASGRTDAPKHAPALNAARTEKVLFDIGAPYVRVEPERRNKLATHLPVAMQPCLLVPYGVIDLPVPPKPPPHEADANGNVRDELHPTDAWAPRIRYRETHDKPSPGSYPPSAKCNNKTKRTNKRHRSSEATHTPSPLPPGPPEVPPGASWNGNAEAGPSKRRRLDPDKEEIVYIGSSGAPSSSQPPHHHQQSVTNGFDIESGPSNRPPQLRWPQPTVRQPGHQDAQHTTLPYPPPPPDATHGAPEEHLSLEEQEHLHKQYLLQQRQQQYFHKLRQQQEKSQQEKADRIALAARAREAAAGAHLEVDEAAQAAAAQAPAAQAAMSAENMRIASSSTVRYIPSDEEDVGYDHPYAQPSVPAAPAASTSAAPSSQPALTGYAVPDEWEQYVNFDPSAPAGPTHGPALPVAPTAPAALSPQALGATPSFSGVLPGVSGDSGVAGHAEYAGYAGHAGVPPGLPSGFTSAPTGPIPVPPTPAAPAQFDPAAGFPLMDFQEPLVTEASANGSINGPTNGFQAQHPETQGYAGQEYAEHEDNAGEDAYMDAEEYPTGVEDAQDDDEDAEYTDGESGEEDEPRRPWDREALVASLAEIGIDYYAPFPLSGPHTVPALGPGSRSHTPPPGYVPPNRTAHLPDEAIRTDNVFGYGDLDAFLANVTHEEFQRIMDLQVRRLAAWEARGGTEEGDWDEIEGIPLPPAGSGQQAIEPVMAQQDTIQQGAMQQAAVQQAAMQQAAVQQAAMQQAAVQQAAIQQASVQQAAIQPAAVQQAAMQQAAVQQAAIQQDSVQQAAIQQATAQPASNPQATDPQATTQQEAQDEAEDEDGDGDEDEDEDEDANSLFTEGEDEDAEGEDDEGETGGP